MPFKNERAIVSKNGKYVLINNEGKIIVSLQYTFMKDCKNRLFVVAEAMIFPFVLINPTPFLSSIGIKFSEKPCTIL